MINSPLILDIKGNSLDDGPGIRSVVFFKGCPLDCAWCHNPESKRRSAEISFDKGMCVGCRGCIDTCQSGAISFDNQYFIDREKCSLCFSCTDACPSGALSAVGSFMEIDDIAERIIKDKPFFDTSGGGVTLSGGEPTIDISFTSELMKKLKSERIKILVETCGFFSIDKFMDLIYPHADMIYFDIKIMNSSDHKKYCGVPNDLILQNFIRLHDEYRNGGIRIIPRTPLVPGITDTEENIKAIADFYTEHGVKQADLLSYNPLWHDKNTMIGTNNPYSNDKKMKEWISREEEDSCRRIFLNAGIEFP